MKKLSTLLLLCMMMLIGCGSTTGNAPLSEEERLLATLAAELPHNEQYDVVPSLLGTAIYEARYYNDSLTTYYTQYK